MLFFERVINSFEGHNLVLFWGACPSMINPISMRRSWTFEPFTPRSPQPQGCNILLSSMELWAEALNLERSAQEARWEKFTGCPWFPGASKSGASTPSPRLEAQLAQLEARLHRSIARSFYLASTQASNPTNPSALPQDSCQAAAHGSQLSGNFRRHGPALGGGRALGALGLCLGD